MNDAPPVLIFDGVCELCNTSVNFILKYERRPDLLFSASQNLPGRNLLVQFGEDPDAVSTIYLVENGKLYSHSTAALRIARRLRFPLNLLYGFIIVPPFLRNFVYRWIARNRYRWFGKKEICRIPTPEERARFLLE
ncbi:MAG TPA: thiol-disulfide oxidoreductase DCC family protein [Bacteroidetes bacterium]|nr:thiol-disulfide oxidoreductase DCC family protein [Bacteroidota bacterium]